MLLKSFEDTARVCTNIINNERTSNKDRIEACKTRDMAHAHILRLVEQGPMFQHMPEVKAMMVKDRIGLHDQTLTAKALELPEDLISHGEQDDKGIFDPPELEPDGKMLSHTVYKDEQDQE